MLKPARILSASLLAISMLMVVRRIAEAQKPPELGYAFPAAIQRGATATVKLGGYDFTPDMQFFVHDPRLKLNVEGTLSDFLVPEPPYWFGVKGGSPAFPLAREIEARLEATSDLPLGLIPWQVANASGSSGTAVIYISDIREIIEQRDRERPITIDSLPVGVSGRLEKIAEVDRYQFTANKSGPITLELFARRLGSDFHGVVEVQDHSGRQLADAADTRGQDLALTFVAQAGQTYSIAVHDLDFRGHHSYVYRLACTEGPRVVTSIPAYGQRGATQAMELIGFGLATGAARMESVKREIAFPSDISQPLMVSRCTTPFGQTSLWEIPLSDLPQRIYDVQSDQSAMRLEELSIVTGVLRDQQHQYTWTAAKGEAWRLDLQSSRIGSDLDVSLRVLDGAGKELASNDDLPGTLDAGLDFTAPADGDYQCQVSALPTDLAPGSRVYALRLEKRAADFSLSGPQQLNLPVGGKAELTVKAIRHGGFQDAISLEINGLPPYVKTSEKLEIPADKNELKVSLECDAGGAAAAALVQLRGTATVQGRSVARDALFPMAGNRCPREPEENTTKQMLLATTLKAPFSLELVDQNRQRAVHRGTTCRAEFLIHRDQGYEGEILLQMAARQARHRQGIRGPIITVPPGMDRRIYPCYLPEWLETDRTTRMVVLGVAKVADPQGNLRYVAKPADARITMILEGALLKVRHEAKELSVIPGGSFEIPIVVSRSAKLPAAVSVQLVAPEPIKQQIHCDPVTLSAEQTRQVLQVSTSPGDRLNGEWEFQVRATALEQDQWPVVSQTTVAVQFETGTGGNGVRVE